MQTPRFSRRELLHAGACGFGGVALTSITAGVAIVAFLLYTLEPSNPPTPFPKELLLYTTPLVIYGVFRYAMLIASGAMTGPTDIIINDRPFLMTVILWALLAVGIVYKGQEIKRFFERLGPGSAMVQDAAPSENAAEESSL